MTEDTFADLVEYAIARFPADVQRRLATDLTVTLDYDPEPCAVDGVRWAGRYVYSLKLITLNRWAFEQFDYNCDHAVDEIEKTLRHELAHAGGLKHEAMTD